MLSLKTSGTEYQSTPAQHPTRREFSLQHLLDAIEIPNAGFVTGDTSNLCATRRPRDGGIDQERKDVPRENRISCACLL